MQEKEFIEATSRIEQYYEKDYTPQQRRIMYEELKNLDLSRYRQLISAVIRECKFMPRIADFTKTSKEMPYVATSDKTNKKDCNKCDGTGYLIYTKIIKDGNKEYKNTYACICTCENAKKYEGWNIADTEHRTQFYTPYANEISL